MECQECHQRPATLHFTKIINGEKNEIHICEVCAKDKGEFFPGTNSFSIHNLLSGLLNYEKPLEESTGHPFYNPGGLQCPKCGMTYERFTKIGRFGCSECYNTFNQKLDPILKRVHGGNTTHAGKIPKRAGSEIELKRKIKTLKDELQELITEQEFERAAEVRDKIRALESRSEKGGEE
ncbi:UvrB/UvrC motif-containing protein [Pseudalkalibacillus caeni]|uniref:UVR domain-containing protein n=1 Tax=Exobacillus caeni TaxID=2574798 RepID=A0A5R9F245_9BACL|nr:UvrB/UvrC motif-containing protein [Pseudalkalibacillus caeni]TLS35548.1 hypothetical protein FCL54_20180 [Pseudalkalibacillus caeni]